MIETMHNVSPIKKQTYSKFSIGEFGWIWLATAALFLVSAIIAPGTLRWSSLLAMLPFAGILSIIAVGQTLVIQQRGLDISAAGMVTLSGMVVGTVSMHNNSIVLAVAAVLTCALIAGTLNGIFVARLNITPLVATLATNALLVGAVWSTGRGAFRPVSKALESFSHRQMLGLPYSLLLGVLFVVAVAIVMKNTTIGRRFVAVGASPQTARAAGIPVLVYQVGTYIVAALCFSVAGILYAGYIGFASQTAGDSYLLPCIAAVVVGGTPFTGGRGSVVASGVAALFMAQLDQMVLSMGAGTAVQYLIQATAIVMAVTLRRLPALIGMGKTA
jgi:ribose transport system permease protein